MPFKLTIELSDRDLRHFQRELRKAHASVRSADDEEIIGAAAELLAAMRDKQLPDFVALRLDKLGCLLEMLQDAQWPLEKSERSPVLAALAYVCDPEDIIPDEIPGIGLLDDAVMIELVFLELRHEIEAYEDFCRFRSSTTRGKRDSRASAEAASAQLARRRKQLVSRMRRRRAAERRSARG
jgi:uncharacterized membrane protein YkvA (DUF1232 family)